MASTYQTLTEILKWGDKNLPPWQASEILQAIPLFGALYSQKANKGSQHEFLSYTTAPTVGFRELNAGTDESPDGYTLKTITLKILAASFTVDKSAVDGFAQGPAVVLAQRGRNQLSSALAAAEKAIIYGTGTGGVSGSFTGLSQATGYTYSDDEMVVDAGGDTVAGCHSAWIINTGESAVSALLGNDGSINVGSTVVIRRDDGSGKFHPAYYTPAEGYLGLQVASPYDMVRIANLDADHPLTDDLIYQALSRFPVGRMGTKLIAMNRDGQRELRESRTATNPTGSPAPYVSEVEGNRVIVTDNLLSTEAVLVAA